MDHLAINGEIIAGLIRNYRSNSVSLSIVHDSIRKIITEESWREFKIPKLNEKVEHSDFRSFVSMPPLKGLGTTMEEIKKVCCDDPKLVDMLDRAEQKPKGNATGHNQYSGNNDNIHISTKPKQESPTGTSQQAGLRRLRNNEETQELYQQVLNGDLSVHSACVKAGFRSPTLTIPIDPQRAAKAILKRFNADEVRHLIDLLQAGG